MATTPQEPEKLIGLIRVSTGRQQESGLGLEAQEAAIEAYRKSVGGVLIKTYKGVESGMKDSIEQRPILRAAVGYARRVGAKLVFAKIDRLVRSTVVLNYLKTRQVRFAACDNPYANELMVDILVAVAADEGRRISTRTKEALAAYKAGRRISKRIRLLYPGKVPAKVIRETAGKLGASLPQCRNLTEEGRAKGIARSAAARTARAIDAYADLAEDIRKWRRHGATLQAIADRLNDAGEMTRQGSAWGPVQVMRVLHRITPA
jgi:DNA invertase Pin-like site-specific DNA recombinase